MFGALRPFGSLAPFGTIGSWTPPPEPSDRLEASVDPRRAVLVAPPAELPGEPNQVDPYQAVLLS